MCNKVHFGSYFPVVLTEKGIMRKMPASLKPNKVYKYQQGLCWVSNIALVALF